MRHASRRRRKALSPTRWNLDPIVRTPHPSPGHPHQSFFDKMDTNGDGSVTKEEAIAFWGSNFAKVSAAPPPFPVPGRRRRGHRGRRGCLCMHDR